MANRGLGIDFGTTNTVAVEYDVRNKKTNVFTDKATNLPHPSVIWYRADGSVRVGAEAKKHIEGFSSAVGNSFITSIKRKLGIEENVLVFGQKKSVADVAADIFQFIKDEARTSYDFEDFKEAIVTIPIYFDGKARKELRTAAQKAGIYIKKFVHEPFAAIVGYYHQESIGLDMSQKSNELTLVFDWGGGTLDITLAQMREGRIFELATGGIADRAGDHFDNIIYKYCINECCNAKGIAADKIEIPLGNKDRLMYEVEKNKIDLSRIDNVNIEGSQIFKYDGKMHDVIQSLSRNKFTELIRSDVDDSIAQVHKTLQEANVGSDQVDLVLLIGGSSRIPIVREKLRDIFGHRLREVNDPDTVIAKGAAIIDGLELSVVLSRAVCVRLFDGSNYDVFKVGESASANVCDKAINFFCTDNRDGQAKLVIVEPGGHKTVTKDVVKKVISIPVTTEKFDYERIQSKFKLDDNMILHVHAKAATQPEVVKEEIHDLCFGLQAGTKI
jgi:molecular chaperone DnaK (HSP70)